MVRTLVRAGRARGMVAASLAAGKCDEAYSLCRVHYAVSTAATVGIGSEAAGGVSEEDGDVGVGVGGATGALTIALARFAKEFGLQLPPV